MTTITAVYKHSDYYNTLLKQINIYYFVSQYIIILLLRRVFKNITVTIHIIHVVICYKHPVIENSLIF